MTRQNGTIKITLLVIIVALVAALVYVVVERNPKEVVCTREAKLCPDGSAVGRIGPNCEFAACPQSSDETAGWKTYRNEEYGFEVKYPSGEVGQPFKNAYLINILVAGIFGIDIFTDESVNEWSASITKAIENNEPVGDPAMLPYPLSVKALLGTKSVGYDCTADFGEYLNKGRNESCEIVEINGAKAFKIVAAGPFQSEVSELKYIFYRNNTWFDASLRIWIFDERDPNKQLYTFEQLNAILQGKASNPVIKAEVDLFSQILSTFKFTK